MASLEYVKFLIRPLRVSQVLHKFWRDYLSKHNTARLQNMVFNVLRWPLLLPNEAGWEDVEFPSDWSRASDVIHIFRLEYMPKRNTPRFLMLNVFFWLPTTPKWGHSSEVVWEYEEFPNGWFRVSQIILIYRLDYMSKHNTARPWTCFSMQISPIVPVLMPNDAIPKWLVGSMWSSSLAG